MSKSKTKIWVHPSKRENPPVPVKKKISPVVEDDNTDDVETTIFIDAFGGEDEFREAANKAGVKFRKNTKLETIIKRYQNLA